LAQAKCLQGGTTVSSEGFAAEALWCLVHQKSMDTRTKSPAKPIENAGWGELP
jgi:hypothetical protein